MYGGNSIKRNDWLLLHNGILFSKKERRRKLFRFNFYHRILSGHVVKTLHLYILSGHVVKTLHLLYSLEIIVKTLHLCIRSGQEVYTLWTCI